MTILQGKYIIPSEMISCYVSRVGLDVNIYVIDFLCHLTFTNTIYGSIRIMTSNVSLTMNKSSSIVNRINPSRSKQVLYNIIR